MLGLLVLLKISFIFISVLDLTRNIFDYVPICGFLFGLRNFVVLVKVFAA